jgi:PAS domain S-box-containing protein
MLTGEALVAALFTHSPLSIALYDAAGRVAAGNAAYERHFGVRVADVPAAWSLFTDPQLAEAGITPLLRRAFAGEVVTLPPVRYDAAAATGGPGRAVWTQGHCYPVRGVDTRGVGEGPVAAVGEDRAADGAADRVTHLAVLHVDVTAWAEAEAEVARATALVRDEAAAREAVLGQLAEGVIVADAAGRITFVNEAAARLHGVARLDVAPEAYAETYHLLTEDGRPYPSAELPLARAVLRGETVLEAPWRIVRPDGTEVRAVGSARPVRGPDGAPVGAVLTVRDDTARAAAEASLRAANAELAGQNLALEEQGLELELANQQLQDVAAELEVQAEALQDANAHLTAALAEAVRARRDAEAARAHAAGILEGTADAYFALDADFRIIAVNAAMERGSGLSRDQLVGRVFWDAFPGAVGTAFERHYRAAATERAEAHFTHDYSDGRLDMVVEVDAYPAEGGGVAVFWRDVTERARVEAERERLLAAERAARAAAEHATAAKEQFLATMSHELRTPLNATLGYAQLLELGIAGPLTGAQRGYLERLTTSSQHLLGLVNDVLDLAKMDAGAARVARRDATTGPAVRAALDLVRPQAAARGVQLVDRLPDDDGEPYVGDEDRVRQVVLNLLSNAVKFTPPGGTVAVACGASAETPAAAGHLRGGGPWAYVRVADTGAGIAPDEQARIFDPFHQVEGGFTRAAGGTGLGLAISRQLARLMGGDLTVESTPGVGSAFTLWLPAARRAGGPQAGVPDGAPVGTADARNAPAERDASLAVTPGLGRVGELLRASVDEVLAAYVGRLRDDPGVPAAGALRRIQLEDHAVSFLADLAQSLVIVEDAGPEAAALLADGSAIQRTIAEAHGARRFAQRFDEAALRRDHQIFRAEVERALRGRLRPDGADEAADATASPDADVDAAVQVLLGLVDRAEAISVHAWHRAAEAAGDPGG